MAIQVIPGPAVMASYHLSANTTVAANTPINFDVKDIDNQGSVVPGANTWVFTAPLSGSYAISLTVDTTGSSANLLINKNSGTDYYSVTGTSGSIMTGFSVLNLNVGDTISIEGDASTTYLGISGGIQLSSVNIYSLF